MTNNFTQNGKESSLFDLFKKYRTGKEDESLRGLVDYKTIFNKQHEYVETTTTIKNVDLLKMARKAYFNYTYPPETDEEWKKPVRKSRYKNFKGGRFADSLNDMYDIFVEEFALLAEDSTFNPTNQTELCQKLKCGVSKYVNLDRLVRDFECDSIDIDDTNIVGDFIPNPGDKASIEKWKSEIYESGWIEPFREMIDILQRIDIDDLLRSNSTFNKNLARLLTKPYMYEKDSITDYYTLKSAEAIKKYFQKNYGKYPTDSEITRGLDKLYQVLMECTIGYTFCGRQEYNNEHSKDKRGKKLKVYGYTNHKIHLMLSSETEKAIAECFSEDYNIVTKEYGGAFNLLTNRVDETVKVLQKAGYEPDREKILDIALFEYRKPDEEKDEYKTDKTEYWCFKQGNKGKLRLERYKKNDDGSYNIIKSKIKIFDDIPDCYKIGNCIIYADDKQKELSYLQKENRFVTVYKRDEKYYGQTIGLI